MSIKTFRKYGEMRVLNKDDTAITLNFKHIPSIEEIGICIEDASVNATYGFWIETKASLGTNLILIQEEFDWLASGEALRILVALEEWVAK